MSTYRFYEQTTREAVTLPRIPDGMKIHFWTPSLTRVPPPIIRSKVQWVWWLFHNLRLFRNREFTVVYITRGDQLALRAGVFPGFFRFPFMERRDLQIGDIWTAPEERGRGLAGIAISAALARYGAPGRRFWYIVDEENAASIRVIEKAGFHFAGTGRRLPRAGLSPLGYFALLAAAPAGTRSLPLPDSVS